MKHPFGASLPPKKYFEDFQDGSAGWWGWNGNSSGFRQLELAPSAVISRSPWWIDYNHAPPGAGYLHVVFALDTKGPFGEAEKESAGPNGFVNRGMPRDFTNAQMSFRLKGELEPRGANLIVLVQATNGQITSGWALVGQPLTVTREWSEQTITLRSDSKEWVCTGSRHDRQDFYGRMELTTLLQEVNCNILLILFPLTIVPMGPINGDPHVLRPGKDYPVWMSQLPEGYVVLDWVAMDFNAPGGRE